MFEIDEVLLDEKLQCDKSTTVCNRDEMVHPEKIQDTDHQFEEIKNKFQELDEKRIIIQESMNDLRGQILEEKDLWRREIDMILEYTKANKCVCHLSKSQPNLQASGGSIDDSVSANRSEGLNTNEVNSDREMTSEAAINEDTIQSYEKKIARYQEILAATQAENKSTLRKRLIANAFRRRLQEVENMCASELLRVQQNIFALQPLKTILTDWSRRDAIDYGTGDQGLSFSSKWNQNGVALCDTYQSNLSTRPARHSLSYTTGQSPRPTLDDELTCKSSLSLDQVVSNISSS